MCGQVNYSFNKLISEVICLSPRSASVPRFTSFDTSGLKVAELSNSDNVEISIVLKLKHVIRGFPNFLDFKSVIGAVQTTVPVCLVSGNGLEGLFMGNFYRLHDTFHNLVRVGIGGGSTILQVTFPVMGRGVDRDSDRSGTVACAKTELVN